VGASFDFGFAKAMAQYFGDSKDGSSDSHGWMIGGQINLGSGYFPVSYATVKDNDAHPLLPSNSLRATLHNMSKRTALYSTFSYIENRMALRCPAGAFPAWRTRHGVQWTWASAIRSDALLALSRCSLRS
jgi:hypothetical protein